MSAQSTKSKWGRGEARLNYAITDAKIATVYNGRRVVKTYTSGQKLVGKIAVARPNML